METVVNKFDLTLNKLFAVRVNLSHVLTHLLVQVCRSLEAALQLIGQSSTGLHADWLLCGSERGMSVTRPIKTHLDFKTGRVYEV